MRKVIFSLLLFLSFIFFTLPCWSATYYIDFVGGDDTNNGTSDSTAFQHCPGDDNATDTSASTTPAAGDTIIFKGGIQYDGRVDLDWSGSSPNYITYDGNTAGTWGTGKAIIDGGDTRNWGFYTISARDYIKIDNFEIRDIKELAAPNHHAGIQIGATGSDSSYLTVQNCYIWDVGHWEVEGTQPYGSGVAFVRASNSLIDSNEIYRTSKWGVRLYGPQTVTVSNNDIHDNIAWGIDICSDYRDATNNIVSDNALHDMWHYDCIGATSCTDEGCWTGDCADNPHTDYIFIRYSHTRTHAPENTIIERNFFYNDKDFTDLDYDGTAFVSDDGNGSIYRNNLFVNAHSVVCFQTELHSSNTEIYNNTFYHPRRIALRIWVAGATLKNNIIIGGTINYYFTTEAAHDDIVSDYNLFVDLSCCSVWVGTGCKCVDLSAWNTRTGDDGNSNEVSAIADVKFIDISGYPSSCSTMDLSLQSDSPAVETGVDLSGEGFSNDYDSTSRPQGVNWEIGAYEFDPEGEASGTIIPGGCQESEIVTGGKTIIVTLSGDEWHADLGDDNAQTTAFIAGFDSAQSEGGGWNAKMRDDDLTHTAVTRTSATVATVILPAVADYQITANETITLTIPDTATVGEVEIVCTPTFQISAEQIGAETIGAVYDATGPAAVYDATGLTVN